MAVSVDLPGEAPKTFRETLGLRLANLSHFEVDITADESRIPVREVKSCSAYEWPIG